MKCKKRNTRQRNLKILKYKRGQEISLINPIALTNGFRKACGEEEVEKKLREEKCLQAFKNGRKVDSMSMIEFKDQMLPAEIIRYMSFRVKAHIQPSIMCSKCQRYVHIPEVCMGKQ